ncbi:hypothetical protein ACN2WE_05240 [Streptomyces sp. cg28]|uniref:hypothetical protein n=1 Tax=Streptomyces sp. cg28 TaxID=3403457 RepID=UPI003B2281D9
MTAAIRASFQSGGWIELGAGRQRPIPLQLFAWFWAAEWARSLLPGPVKTLLRRLHPWQLQWKAYLPFTFTAERALFAYLISRSFP